MTLLNSWDALKNYTLPTNNLYMDEGLSQSTAPWSCRLPPPPDKAPVFVVQDPTIIPRIMKALDHGLASMNLPVFPVINDAPYAKKTIGDEKSVSQTFQTLMHRMVAPIVTLLRSFAGVDLDSDPEIRDPPREYSQEGDMTLISGDQPRVAVEHKSYSVVMAKEGALPHARMLDASVRAENADAIAIKVSTANHPQCRLLTCFIAVLAHG